MRVGERLLALGLVAVLALPVGALAASPQARQEDLDYLCAQLERGHPDLYAHVTREEVLARKGEIQQIMDTADEFAFAASMQSLVALVGDSHTSLNLGQASKDIHILPMVLTQYQGQWILSQVLEDHKQLLGSQVTAVNGIPMDALIDRYRTLVSADNEVWLLRQFRQMCYVQEVLEWLGVAQPDQAVTLSLLSPKGEARQLSLTALSAQEQGTAAMASLKSMRSAVPATEADKQRAYFSLPLDQNSYYIQYNRCQNDPELPMADFALQVQKELAQGTYTKVLVDLRNNGGGSDGVIQPLLTVLAQERQTRGTRIFCLTGEGTFSSAVINTVMLKELGAILAGGPTGGSVDHFGAVKSLTLPNSGLKLGFSSKFIDMETLLAAGTGYGIEPMRPDLAVEQTLADYLAGRDTLVDTVLRTGDSWVLPENETLSNTRGGFVERLWTLTKQAGGQVDGAKPCAFRDAFPFASYLPALDWAKEQGLVSGIGQDLFAPAATITGGEGALILERFLPWAQTHLAPGKGAEIAALMAAD